MEEGNDSWSQYFESKSAVNFAISGDKTGNVLWRIQNGNLGENCPTLVVLHIGSNNLIEGESPNDVVVGILEILNTIRRMSPKTKILLMALLPLGRTKETEIRTKIDEVNRLLSTRVHDVAITGINIGHILLNEDLELPQAVSPDGIHYSKIGYQLWAEAIIPTVNKLLESNIKLSPQNKIKLREAHVQKLENYNYLKKQNANVTISSEKALNLTLPKPIEMSYCINLDGRKDRWEQVNSQFLKLGLKVERWPAVNSRDIVWEGLDMTERAKHFLPHRITHEDLPSLGAIGCYLSHVSIWQHMIDENISLALIFEDDLQFPSNYIETLTDYCQTLFDGRDLEAECNPVDVLLMACPDNRKNKKPTPLHKDLVRIEGPFFGTGAYLLTNYGAKMLMKKVFPIEVQVDAYMGIQASLEHTIGFYGTESQLIHINTNSESDIQTDNLSPGDKPNWLIIILSVSSSVSLLFCVSQYVIYRKEKLKLFLLARMESNQRL